MEVTAAFRKAIANGYKFIAERKEIEAKAQKIGQTYRGQNGGGEDLDWGAKKTIDRETTNDAAFQQSLCWSLYRHHIATSEFLDPSPLTSRSFPVGA